MAGFAGVACAEYDERVWSPGEALGQRTRGRFLGKPPRSAKNQRAKGAPWMGLFGATVARRMVRTVVR